MTALRHARPGGGALIPIALAAALVGAGVLLRVEAQQRSAGAQDAFASGLLDRARVDLAEGQTDAAQRMLEQLVANFPETGAAAEARRALYVLYARAVVPDRPVPDRQPERPDNPSIVTPSERAATAGPSTASPAATSSWRTSVTSYRRLQDELRNTLGDRLFFSLGSADLGGRGRVLVAAQADWLKQRPEIEVVVEGHADDAGGGVDNDEISQRRASVVRDSLTAAGVLPARIRLMPRGSRDPIAICEDSACAAQNRRVVLQLALRGQQLIGDPAADAAAAGPPGQAQR